MRNFLRKYFDIYSLYDYESKLYFKMPFTITKSPEDGANILLLFLFRGLFVFLLNKLWANKLGMTFKIRRLCMPLTMIDGSIKRREEDDNKN